MKESKLFSVLPEYICTPGGMAIDRAGNLVLSCPNYAREDLSGCFMMWWMIRKVLWKPIWPR